MVLRTCLIEKRNWALLQCWIGYTKYCSWKLKASVFPDNRNWTFCWDIVQSTVLSQSYCIACCFFPKTHLKLSIIVFNVVVSKLRWHHFVRQGFWSKPLSLPTCASVLTGGLSSSSLLLSLPFPDSHGDVEAAGTPRTVSAINFAMSGRPKWTVTGW